MQDVRRGTERLTTGRHILRSDWIEKVAPLHPSFDQPVRVAQIRKVVRGAVVAHVQVGVGIFVRRHALPSSAGKTSERQLLLALQLRRYGVIYLLDRRGARAALAYAKTHAYDLSRANQIWDDSGSTDSVFNWAVHSFVRSYAGSLAVHERLVPPFGFQTLSDGRFAVRACDFLDRNLEDSWSEPKALYDLHDFSHWATATLNPSLYGNYYHGHLDKLPAHYQHLITSPNLASGSAPFFSDGFIFSDLLTHLFEEMDYWTLSCADIVEYMATRVRDYLLAIRPLFSSRLNRWLLPERRISVLELAVLAQNKSYELPASEMEQQLFTRGGASSADHLMELDILERLEEIANAGNTYLHFEKRNVTKHRAQKEAYRLTSLTLLENDSLTREEIRLLAEVIDNLTYSDWRAGRRVNLITRVAELLAPEPCADHP
jgi:hypothetical protein